MTNIEEPSGEEETLTPLEEQAPRDVQQQKELSALARATDTEAFRDESFLDAEEIIQSGFFSALRATYGNEDEARDALQGALEYLLEKGHYQRLVDESPQKLRAWLITKAKNIAIDTHREKKRRPTFSSDEREEYGDLLPDDPVDVEDRLIEESIIANLSSMGLNAKGLRAFFIRMFDLEDSMSAAERKNLQRARSDVLKHAGLEAAEAEAMKLIMKWQRLAGWNAPASAARDFARCAAGVSDLPATVKERPVVPPWLSGLDVDGQTRALVRAYTSGRAKLSILMRHLRTSTPDNLAESEA